MPRQRLAERQAYRVKRNAFRSIGLSLLIGIYQFYWFYVTREIVTNEVGGKDRVGLQTLGTAVPILNIWIAYWLLRDIDKLVRSQKRPGFSPMSYVLTPTLLLVFSTLLLIPGIVLTVVDVSPISIIIIVVAAAGLFAGIIVAYVFWALAIGHLNRYWDLKSKGRAEEADYSTGELVVIAVGLVLLFANTLGSALIPLFDQPDPGPWYDGRRPDRI